MEYGRESYRNDREESINSLNDISTNYLSLYDTVKKIYETKTVYSRVLYITKMKEQYLDNQKVDRVTTLSSIRDEIKKYLKQIEANSNLMIFYISTLYAFVAIENSNDNLMLYLSKLHKAIKSGDSFHETVNIIAFDEESPVSYFPTWYKYEGSAYDKESQQYKDKAVTEKVNY